MSTTDEMLCLWEQAGPRPHEVLQEEGVYDTFVDILRTSPLDLDQAVFRGTYRHSELDVGDLLDYSDAPKAWSLSAKVAHRFVDRTPTPVILRLESPRYGLLHMDSFYGEEECILPPAQYRVVKRDVTAGVTHLMVEHA